MAKQQLFLFSLAMILILGNGQGMASLLPVYLGRMGAEPDYVGFLFACLYLALSVSGILAGWMADRFQRRKLMCVLSAAGEIFTGILLIVARSLPVLSLALVLAWFLAGIHIALVNVLVGLQAEENKRGQVFGFLGFVIGLGPILSGFLYGRIMDRYGFGALFVISLVISVLWTVLALFYKEVPKPAEYHDLKTHSQRAPLGGGFILLVIASILGWITINGGKLGISIIMNSLNFSANDISTTAGIASLVALPMPLLLGWLSDRTGRKGLIIGLNFLGIASLVFLSKVFTLPGYWLSSSLLSLYSCFTGLSIALATDILPLQALGIGISLISGTSNIAGIFSSALLGLALGSLGPSTTFLIGLVLPITAIILLVFGTNHRLAVLKFTKIILKG
jgi:MFS family permease